MADGPAPVELHGDCASCGLESGVVETYDALVPACRFGLPASARCKLCGVSAEGTFGRAPIRDMREVPANRCPACLALLAPEALDERRCASCGAAAELVTRSPGRRFACVADLATALDAWAERDGYASRQALLDATFCQPVVEILYAFVVRKERLEVVADPFAAMGTRPAGSTGATAAPKLARPAGPPAKPGAPASTPGSARADALGSDAPVRTAPMPEASFAAGAFAATDPMAPPLPSAPPPSAPPPPAPPPSAPLPSASPPSAPPRAIVFPLVSVITADGEIHPEERALVDRFLRNEGLPPLTDDEFRVHHPSEVAHLVPAERRNAVVQLMCETAAVDGLPDESERRVIRAYAAAWHVPDEKVDFWMWGYENMSTSLARQLWLKLRRFVLSARWGAEQEEHR